MKSNPTLQLSNLNYEGIKIDQEFSFERLVDKQLVDEFAKLSGDFSPLHMDDSYAKTTKFGERIAHGMLLASFFSALVGMLCPGKKGLYLSQTANFKNPCRLGDKLIVMGKIKSKSDSTRTLELSTIIKNTNGKILVDGSAMVKFLE
ncbi:MAG: MaoC family dehydratase [Candidatus Harrisonbacteria bacterium]|nr:MaoC family dehydratase [Candidatus Harrisonbacteria bacterium]